MVEDAWQFVFASPSPTETASASRHYASEPFSEGRRPAVALRPIEQSRPIECYMIAAISPHATRAPPTLYGCKLHLLGVPSAWAHLVSPGHKGSPSSWLSLSMMRSELLGSCTTIGVATPPIGRPFYGSLLDCKRNFNFWGDGYRPRPSAGDASSEPPIRDWKWITTVT